jgi:hypothetical protein
MSSSFLVPRPNSGGDGGRPVTLRIPAIFSDSRIGEVLWQRMGFLYSRTGKNLSDKQVGKVCDYPTGLSTRKISATSIG